MVNVIAIVGSSIWMCGSGFRILGVRDGLADGDAFHARDGQNVAGPANGFVHALQAFERVQLRDLVLCNEPSSLQMATSSPWRSVPLKTRPMASRPR